MLEFFRKHKGAFLITITVVIIISFSIWGGWKGKDEGQRDSSAKAFTLYGKDYTIAEFQRVQRSMQLIGMLQLYELFDLGSIAQDPDTRGEDFIFNLLVLREEMKRAGIHPSNAEAEEELKKTQALQENGAFSLQRFQTVQSNLGPMGFKDQDLLDTIKLKIGFAKLQALIKQNYVPSPLAVEKEYAKMNQTLKVSTIPFRLEDFKKDIKVTDEDIQKYYDETKETHKTAEKRAVSYVFFENPKDLDKKPLEERQKLQSEALDKVNKFTDLTSAPNADLTNIATEQKVPVQTLPAFTRSEAPDAIKTERELINAIFRFDKTIRTVSDAIKGNNGFYVFTVTNVEEPQQQELSAVKDKIKETLVAQRAQEAMSKAVNDAQKALTEGLKEGKKIEDLTKELKLTLTPKIDFDISQPPQEIPEATEIAPVVAETPPGQITSAIESATGATLVYVHAKELRKREDSPTLRKSMEETIASTERNRIFEAWFTRKRAAAGLKLHL